MKYIFDDLFNHTFWCIVSTVIKLLDVIQVDMSYE